MSTDLIGGKYKKAYLVFASNRMDTFVNWGLNGEDSPCRAEKMAEAGFKDTSANNVPSAACVFCNKELCFDEGDDPWAEHVKRGEECPFVKLNKLDERTWTVADYLFLLGAAHINEEVVETQNVLTDIYEAGKEVKKSLASATNRK